MIALLLGLAPDAPVPHTFRVVPPHAVRVVHLAGSFNNWDRNATTLTTSDGRAWSVTLSLTPGKYSYKFVLDDNEWIADPSSPGQSDGNGNVNSVLVLMPSDYDRPARPDDGVLAASALEHFPRAPYLNFDRGHLTLGLRERPNDAAETKVEVRGVGAFAMKSEPIDELYSRYSANVPWDRKHDVRYHFELVDGGKTFEFGPNGLGDASDFVLSAATYRPFEVPSWVERSVIYQIFPDRFANGDPSNDPKDVVPWDSAPTYANHFGGDFAGVRQHLGYLKDLGVSAVYFNPIFKAGSNHRYDTIDYLTVDPELGTNAEFGALTREMRRDGIRTVLDGVFNHTSTKFFAFDDVVHNGAKSKYTHWYTFHSFPVRVEEHPNYVAWFDYPSMPKLNQRNPETRKYLLNVPNYWAQNADISGWRLDVANEVPMDYWRDFRSALKQRNPDMWIVGEEWGDATPWLQGDQWDSVMNYPFRQAVLGFVGTDGSGKPSDLLNGLMADYERYVPQVSRNAMNLIGSHDTPRILTMCGGDRRRALLAADIQFTWAGTPSIYYGDELGMEGGKDPDNRRGMAWKMASASNEFLAHYKKLVALRTTTPALESGDPEPLAVDDAHGTAVYARVLDANKGQFAIVALNRSEQPQEVTLPSQKISSRTYDFVDALDGHAVSAAPSGQPRVRLAPESAAILIPRLGLSLRTRPRTGTCHNRRTLTLSHITL
jgi:glycosidase